MAAEHGDLRCSTAFCELIVPLCRALLAAEALHGVGRRAMVVCLPGKFRPETDLGSVMMRRGVFSAVVTDKRPTKDCLGAVYRLVRAHGSVT